ncbi:hypothetical protein [Alkalimonas amylolytica]|uniref:Uncharacterized protein n=1 Tax=Alkalimonas amylolytica TaxID=152573 RepID=A0A1H4D607_ALKAM|nr:hypothetical protein [Alkalimonas amylolytica]SEA68233.1 hypothetical protein SAMN04488051_10592 [Alkalimonas amylolytica]
MNAWLSIAHRLLWPSRMTQILWVLLLAASAAAMLSSDWQGIIVVPLVAMMLLLFFIPLQFIPLTLARSWLLLPHFRQHSRHLLLAVALVFGLLSGSLLHLTGAIFWQGLQLGLLAFCTVILLSLLLARLWPLLIFSTLLLAQLLNLNLFLTQLPPFAWWLIALLNALLLGWFALSWLQPSNVARRLQRSKGQQGFMPWELSRLVRCQPASLQGSLLLGANDNLLLRCCRTWALCWYLPVIFIVLAYLTAIPKLDGKLALSAFAVLFPVIAIAANLSTMMLRVRSAWLQLASNRQQLFYQLERQAFLELFLGLIAITPVILWLLPFTTALVLLLLWPLCLLSHTYFNWWLIHKTNLLKHIASTVLFVLILSLLAAWREQPTHLLLLTAGLAPMTLLLRLKARQQCAQQNWSSLQRPPTQQRQTKL